MADIKIRQVEAVGFQQKETNIEITGADYINDELVKSLVDKVGRSALQTTEATPEAQQGKPEEKEAPAAVTNMRRVTNTYISPATLKEAIKMGLGESVIRPFDEIDIPLDTGGTVTVVCGYVDGSRARMVFKDCWDEAVMNEENTNKTGYHGSKGRKHVLEDIYPHLPQEWKDIITPRHIVENIGGQQVEYDDPMWLPSATDVFGPSEDGYWEDLGENFQLPIFERERDRVKECGDNGTYPYWLRSVAAGNTNGFRRVGTSGGSGNYSNAYYSRGFAPGFDI